MGWPPTEDPADADYCRHGFYHGEGCEECEDERDPRPPSTRAEIELDGDEPDECPF